MSTAYVVVVALMVLSAFAPLAVAVALNADTIDCIEDDKDAYPAVVVALGATGCALFGVWFGFVMLGGN